MHLVGVGVCGTCAQQTRAEAAGVRQRARSPCQRGRRTRGATCHGLCCPSSRAPAARRCGCVSLGPWSRRRCRRNPQSRRARRLGGVHKMARQVRARGARARGRGGAQRRSRGEGRGGGVGEGRGGAAAARTRAERRTCARTRAAHKGARTGAHKLHALRLELLRRAPAHLRLQELVPEQVVAKPDEVVAHTALGPPVLCARAPKRLVLPAVREEVEQSLARRVLVASLSARRILLRAEPVIGVAAQHHHVHHVVEQLVELFRPAAALQLEPVGHLHEQVVLVALR
eukprot:6165822-Prymnesium_polylepis.2